jgi:hypothetical protein
MRAGSGQEAACDKEAVLTDADVQAVRSTSREPARNPAPRITDFEAFIVSSSLLVPLGLRSFSSLLPAREVGPEVG